MILTDNNLGILYYGWNAGPECTGELGKCGCIHAEIAGLDTCSPKICVISLQPCPTCTRALVNAGIVTIFYEDECRHPDACKFAVDNGVHVLQWSKLTDDQILEWGKSGGVRRRVARPEARG